MDEIEHPKYQNPHVARAFVIVSMEQSADFAIDRCEKNTIVVAKDDYIKYKPISNYV